MKKVFGQMAFASVVLVIGSFLYHYFWPNNVVYLQHINMFNDSWWYVGYYIGIVIIAELFLNQYLMTADKKRYAVILAISFSIASQGWLGGIFTTLASDLRVVSIGVFLFTFGAYIRQYDPFREVPRVVFLFIITFVYILVWISCLNTNAWSIQDYIINGKTDNYSQILTAYADYQIVPVVIALSIFEIVKRINIPNNKIINYLGSASFMVFLIHGTDFGYYIIRQNDWLYCLHCSVWLFWKEIVFYTFVIYAIGVLSYMSYCCILKSYRLLIIK